MNLKTPELRKLKGGGMDKKDLEYFAKFSDLLTSLFIVNYKEVIDIIESEKFINLKEGKISIKGGTLDIEIKKKILDSFTILAKSYTDTVLESYASAFSKNRDNPRKEDVKGFYAVQKLVLGVSMESMIVGYLIANTALYENLEPYESQIKDTMKHWIDGKMPKEFYEYKKIDTKDIDEAAKVLFKKARSNYLKLKRAKKKSSIKKTKKENK